ncbi:MAG: HlyD family efflux transporter periplasmic adaptor subunit [Bacillota bacterium]|nr:HlyD family efflux transporter periplasmic adaptor subunit [Bacillota bacterium]
MAKKKRRRRNTLTIVLLLAIFVAAIVLFGSFFRFKQLKFAQPEVGSYDVTFDGEAVVARNEYVIDVSAGGEFTPLFAEGERVKEGALIGRSSTENGQQINYYAPIGGLISYQADGYEQLLTPSSLGESVNWIALLEQLRRQPQADGEAANGAQQAAPTAKVIDNLLDFTVFVCSMQPLSAYQESGKLTFLLKSDTSGGYITGYVDSGGSLSDGSNYLLLSVSAQEMSLYGQRYQRIDVIGDTVYGALIPATALVYEQDGSCGVFCQYKQTIVYTEVEVLAERDGSVVVTNIDANDLIVTNPERARDGQKIY